MMALSQNSDNMESAPLLIKIFRIAKPKNPKNPEIRIKQAKKFKYQIYKISFKNSMKICVEEESSKIHDCNSSK